MIACVTIPDFAAAVERRAEPALVGVPLIFGEPPERPERVLAASREAMGQGVRPGISLRQARLLCPQARLIAARTERYAGAFNELLDVLADFTSQLEPAETSSTASSYLELGYLSSADRLEVVQQIGRTVREKTRLAPALGLAGGKFPPHVAATSVVPNKALIIAPGREATFLAPRPINLLPLDEELARRFHYLGLRSLGQLAALPAGAVLAQFGTYGRWLHQLARGRDDRPVLPYRPPPVEQVSRRFEEPVSDRLMLIALSRAMAAELAARLQTSGRAGRELRLRLELENGTEWLEQAVLRRSTANPERLAQSLTSLVEQVQVSCGLLALTISLAGLAPASGQQLDLFVHGGEQEHRLQGLLPDLVARYGSRSFYAATVIDRTAYLPERRFLLWPLEAQ